MLLYIMVKADISTSNCITMRYILHDMQILNIFNVCFPLRSVYITFYIYWLPHLKEHTKASIWQNAHMCKTDISETVFVRPVAKWGPNRERKHKTYTCNNNNYTDINLLIYLFFSKNNLKIQNYKRKESTLDQNN